MYKHLNGSHDPAPHPPKTSSSSSLMGQQQQQLMYSSQQQQQQHNDSQQLELVLSEVRRLEEVAQHILVPCQDMPRTHFRSLMDRELRLVGDNTLVFNVDEDEKEEDKIDQVQATILFRETFYTDDMHKHEVFCVDRMLSTPSQAGP